MNNFSVRSSLPPSLSLEAGTSSRILLVALGGLDGPVLAHGLREAGFYVTVPRSLAEADGVVRAGEHDAVVLDLAGMQADALCLLRRWRDDGLGVPVALLTEASDRAAGIRGLNAGADTFVARPVSPALLLTYVRAILRSSNTRIAPVVRVRDLEINTATRVVERAGKRIKLTARQYAILEVLAARRGKVVSRTTLWQRLDGGGLSPRSNMVDVYIAQLRNKIDAGFNLPLILTSRGWGYFLRDDEAAGCCAG